VISTGQTRLRFGSRSRIAMYFERS